MEEYNKMASESGVVRVDLGAEIDSPPGVRMLRTATESSLNAEIGYIENVKSTGAAYCAWQPTGKGYIVRPFINEMTTTLDCNWFQVRRTMDGSGRKQSECM